MANLASPGVQVTVIDESFYTPAAPGTVPLIFVASAANKQNSSGTGTAQGTLEANAGTVYVITSQRDLTDTFGTPYFETDNSNNPINASEISEYGLQSAYSLLGVSSRAYVVRADIDLGELAPSTSAPTGMPVGGTYWVDTAKTSFGINVWNTVTNTFSLQTPLIINNDNMATAMSQSVAGAPADNFGKQGNFAVVVTSDNDITMPQAIWYKTQATSNAWIEVGGSNWYGDSLQLVVAPHTQYPDFTAATGSSAPTGSVWVKTTTPGQGANWNIQHYNASTEAWTTVVAPVYTSTTAALYSYDSVGGGTNIASGALFVEADPDHWYINTGTNTHAEFKIWRYSGVGSTSITSAGSSGSTTTNSLFYVRESIPGSNAWSGITTITVPGLSPHPIGQAIANQINLSGLAYLSASFNATTNKTTITHTAGGDFELYDHSGALALAGFSAYSVDPSTNIPSGTPNLYAAPKADGWAFTGQGASFADAGLFLASSWGPLVYESSAAQPTTAPANGTLWFDSNYTAVDIMYNNGTHWQGYANAFPNTDPNGPIVSATAPTTQSGPDYGNLVNGDIWVSTADMDMYGANIYVYSTVNGWVLQDTTDHHTPNGWVFADARWSGAGDDVQPDSIATLLTYDYVDPDCVDPALYPKGTRLWNTRRSGNNVKKYVTGYIDINANNGLNDRYPYDVNGAGESMAAYNVDRWVSVDSQKADGSGNFGRFAQRAVVTSAFKALIDTNQSIRDTETLQFNLIACPGYPEAVQNMVDFNTEIGNTAFVVGDTPFRLEPTGTALSNWGNNTAMATDNNETGVVTYDDYLAFYYPSGLTNDNKGNTIVVPPSHMMLNTIVNSDAVSYEWFAPAGLNRGGIINATSAGYVDMNGVFQSTAVPQSLRDVLAGVKINPISTLQGSGLVCMGQYSRAKVASALDRINVVRLVAYLRRQLNILAKPYLFEPNDAQTRKEIKGAVDSVLLELVGQRALNDFIVVCDTTNNTPARIDRSELHVDIAIEPVKAVEFIYIPLRILNTGAIASGNYGSLAA